MQCEYAAIGKQDGRTRYRCSVCGHERLSRYQPEQIHRECRPLVAQRVPRGDLSCIHRGAATGETKQCDTCGRRDQQEPVYECAIHGKCVLRWWTNDARKRKESGECPCITCRDRTLPDGSEPYREFLRSQSQ